MTATLSVVVIMNAGENVLGNVANLKVNPPSVETGNRDIELVEVDKKSDARAVVGPEASRTVITQGIET